MGIFRHFLILPVPALTIETAGGTQNWTSFGRQNDAALVGKMIVSPEVIVEAAGPLGDAPSRPIKAFYNLCGYDPSETPYAGKTGIMSD